jgi:hypothetical protein
LNNTIGESIKEGWKQTAGHSYISHSIPKIEQLFVQEFQKLFNSERSPVDEKFSVSPVAARHNEEGDESTIEVKARQTRSRPVSDQ